MGQEGDGRPAEPQDEGEGLGFDMLAASIRADASDLSTFLDAFAVKLESALPGWVRVDREAGLFKKEHRVRGISVQIEDKVFQVYRSGAGLEARFLHQVRGITLKNEVVRLDEWIGELSRHLARHAQTSAEARAAMQRMVT
jgi:hypothetical protein